jgi:DNA invertase Pin-like site-specific DNA recombinase
MNADTQDLAVATVSKYGFRDVTKSGGQGGRRSNADKKKLAETSETYSESAAIKRTASKDGDVVALFRLSHKTKASLGDKSQHDEVMSMISRDGWREEQVAKVWETGSAWKKGKYRPVIDDILKGIRAGEVSAIYCYEVPRLTRDPNVAKKLQTEAQTFGVPIRFVDSPDLKPEQEDMVNEILYVVMVQKAKASSDETSNRTKRGQKFRAKHGIKRGGLEPLGMKTVLYKSDLRANPVPYFAANEEADATLPSKYSSPAALLRSIFDDAVSGAVAAKTARRLNDEGVPTLNGSKQWSNATVSAILTNPMYIGWSTYKGKVAPACGFVCDAGCSVVEEIYKNKDGEDRVREIVTTVCQPAMRKLEDGTEVRPNEQMISDANFELVSSLLEGRKALNLPRARSKGYRLAGVIRCANCGAKMVGQSSWTSKSGKGRVQPSTYRCPTRIDNPARCTGNSVNSEPVDALVRFVMLGLLRDPARLAKLSKSSDDDQVAVINELQVERERITATIAELQLALDGTSVESVAEAIRKEIVKAGLDLQKVGAKSMLRKETGSAVKGYDREQLLAVWEDTNRVGAQLLVRSLFDRIEITNTNKVGQMNSYTLAKRGWTMNLNRVALVFHDGTRINMGKAADELVGQAS